MQNEIEKLFRENVAWGRTVFLSSHELDEVQRLVVCATYGAIAAFRQLELHRKASEGRSGGEFGNVVEVAELFVARAEAPP